MVDELVSEPLYGNYRAKVVDNKDKEQFGRVLVWIPDLMPLLGEDTGIWARPANNPIGGRNKPANVSYPKELRPPRRKLRGGDLSVNVDYMVKVEDAFDSYQDNFFAGSSYIPPKGSWVWIFFEAGNINRPYYFGGLDLQNTKVLAENQTGANFQNKWTIFKSHAGRTIVVSDDPDDERVEITGKKRLIADPPSGDEWSVFAIDRNQTTILFDERSGQEKILIRTYKGDFVNINIEERKLEIQFSSDIHIKSGGNILMTAAGDIHFLAGGSIHTTADGEINTVSGNRMNIESGEEYNRKIAADSVEHIGGTKVIVAAEDMFLQTEGEQHITAGGDIHTDANTEITDNSGLAQQPPTININAVPATGADPKGERNKKT